MEPRIRELAREARAVVSNADMYLAFLREEKPPAEIAEKAVKVAKANTQAALAFLEDLLRLCDYPRWTASTK